MALVDDQQVIFRKVIQQTERTRPLFPAVQVARIVLDSRAITQLLDHLQVVLYALLEALRLHHPARLLEKTDAFAQIELDLPDGPVGTLPGRYEHVGGENGHRIEFFEYLPAPGIDTVDLFDLVVEHRNPVHRIAVSRHDVDHFALHAERSALELRFGTGIESVHEGIKNLLAAGSLACRQLHARSVEIFRISDTVKTRHARNHDDIPPPGKQRSRGPQAEFLDLLVDGEVFFDVGVGCRKIGLRLVIVVIGNEIFHGVLRKERLEFAVELCRQRFVVAQDERRPFQFGDDVRNGKGLSRTGDSEQGVVTAVSLDGTDQLGDGLGLISGRLIIGY